MLRLYINAFVNFANSYKMKTKRLFEDEKFWNDYWRDNPFFAQKIRLFKALIPDDVKTILDVGCGDGQLLKRLDEYEAIGCDASEVAVSLAGSCAVCADSSNLPFKDKQFDLVICSQVLEHLDDTGFFRTIEELRRVSNRYLIISVPYNENLKQHFTQCGECGRASHISGHLRSFKDSIILEEILDDFVLRFDLICGPKMCYPPNFYRIINQRCLRGWYRDKNWTCQFCGSRVSVAQSIIQKKLGVFLRKILEKLPCFRHRHWWLILLFESKE